MVRQGSGSFRGICISTALAIALSAVAVCFPAPSYAGEVPLPVPAQDRTPLLRGIRVYPDAPFKFDFILDAGNTNDSETLHATSLRLINYFLAALTMPETDLWVNLSPDEPDRIIDEDLALTGLGEDMLEADEYLKRVASSLTHPDTPTGEAYWRVENGKSIIENRFDKVWIIPEKAVVQEDSRGAFITEAQLGVHGENDAMAAILPSLTDRVNAGEDFARVRQMYHSVVLAAWYKKRLKESILGQAYVDQKKIKGIDTSDPAVKDTVYQAYMEAFKKGVYDLIRKERDTTGRLQKRQYFSGGLAWKFNVASALETIPGDLDAAAAAFAPDLMVVEGAVRMKVAASALGPVDDAALAEIEEGLDILRTAAAELDRSFAEAGLHEQFAALRAWLDENGENAGPDRLRQALGQLRRDILPSIADGLAGPVAVLARLQRTVAGRKARVFMADGQRVISAGMLFFDLNGRLAEMIALAVLRQQYIDAAFVTGKITDGEFKRHRQGVTALLQWHEFYLKSLSDIRNPVAVDEAYAERNSVSNGFHRNTYNYLLIPYARLKTSSAQEELSPFESGLRDIVVEHRGAVMAFMARKKPQADNPLGSRALEGFCGESTLDMSRRLRHWAADNKRNLIVREHQAKTVLDEDSGWGLSFPGYSPRHGVTVVTDADTGKHYLIDTTLIQFCDPQTEDGALALEVVHKAGYHDLLRSLLTDGYVELDDRVAAMYAILLKRQYPLDEPVPLARYLQPATISEANAPYIFRRPIAERDLYIKSLLGPAETADSASVTAAVKDALARAGFSSSGLIRNLMKRVLLTGLLMLAEAGMLDAQTAVDSGADSLVPMDDLPSRFPLTDAAVRADLEAVRSGDFSRVGNVLARYGLAYIQPSRAPARLQENGAVAVLLDVIADDEAEYYEVRDTMTGQFAVRDGEKLLIIPPQTVSDTLRLTEPVEPAILKDSSWSDTLGYQTPQPLASVLPQPWSADSFFTAWSSDSFVVDTSVNLRRVRVPAVSPRTRDQAAIAITYIGLTDPAYVTVDAIEAVLKDPQITHLFAHDTMLSVLARKDSSAYARTVRDIAALRNGYTDKLLHADNTNETVSLRDLAREREKALPDDPPVAAKRPAYALHPAAMHISGTFDIRNSRLTLPRAKGVYAVKVYGLDGRLIESVKARGPAFKIPVAAGRYVIDAILVDASSSIVRNGGIDFDVDTGGLRIQGEQQARFISSSLEAADISGFTFEIHSIRPFSAAVPYDRSP